MSVNPIIQNNQLQTESTGPNNIVGKDGFLQLLLLQMRHQDPLNPMNNEQMLSQLAQFSSLEQMSQLNDTVQKSSEMESFLSATSLIGKEASIFDPASPPNQPTEIKVKIKAVTFAEDQPILTLSNGMLSTVDGVFKISEPEEPEEPTE